MQNDAGYDLVAEDVFEAFHGFEFVFGGPGCGDDVDEDDPAVDKL